MSHLRRKLIHGNNGVNGGNILFIKVLEVKTVKREEKLLLESHVVRWFIRLKANSKQKEKTLLLTFIMTKCNTLSLKEVTTGRETK